MDQGIDLQQTFIQSLMDLGLPAGVAKAVWMPLPMLLMIIGATVGVLVSVWLERKISAAVQQRVGPEFIGPLGVLAPVADGLKLIFKEDTVPAKADPLLVYARSGHRRYSSISFLSDRAVWTKPDCHKRWHGRICLDCAV